MAGAVAGTAIGSTAANIYSSNNDFRDDEESTDFEAMSESVEGDEADVLDDDSFTESDVESYDDDNDLDDENIESDDDEGYF
ncbi:MAG: hypothetical protein HC902_03250 [Calothrix sp. SM1_5_4]|nr:hypothetical protein [Calothrix sp. SM1_5_4]